MNSKSLIIKEFISLLAIVFVLSNSCAEEEPSLSNNAKDFLNELLDVMEQNSINRYRIDWTEFRSEVFESAGAAQTVEETYGAVRVALTLLLDNHSFYRAADGTILRGLRSMNCQGNGVLSVDVPDHIGYVKVASFGGSGEEAKLFAEEIQQEVEEQDSPDILGWIVDLRGNGGGNMWPMLAGIGPLLGDGTVGYFIDPDNRQSSWSYANGSSMVNGNSVIEVSDPYETIQSNPRVAVLLDNAVSSSGEAIAIAFVGRENCKSFGRSTCGLSTANSGFRLSNNSDLILTVSYMADRNKVSYGVSIIPDQVSDAENIIQDAIDFIEN